MNQIRITRRRFVLNHHVYRLILLAVIALWFSVESTHAQMIPDPGIADTIRIDSVSVSGVGTAQIPIRFYNDEELGGIEITLHHNSANITIDSVSFVGGRVASIGSKGAIKNGMNTLIYCIPFPTGIPSGNGTFAKLFVSFASNLPTETVRFDSITAEISGQEHSTYFSTSDAKTFKPKFRPGFLVINGSCCVGIRGNVNNDVSQQISLSDLTYLISYLFVNGPPPPCTVEANVNGTGNPTPNLSDLTYLINYLFLSGPPPPACP